MIHQWLSLFMLTFGVWILLIATDDTEEDAIKDTVKRNTLLGIAAVLSICMSSGPSVLPLFLTEPSKDTDSSHVQQDTLRLTLKGCCGSIRVLLPSPLDHPILLFSRMLHQNQKIPPSLKLPSPPLVYGSETFSSHFSVWRLRSR